MEFPNDTESFVMNMHSHPFIDDATYITPSQMVELINLSDMHFPLVDNIDFTMPSQDALAFTNSSFASDALISSLVGEPNFPIPVQNMVGTIDSFKPNDSFFDGPTFPPEATVWSINTSVNMHSSFYHQHPTFMVPQRMVNSLSDPFFGAYPSASQHYDPWTLYPSASHWQPSYEDLGANEMLQESAASPNTQTPVRKRRKRSYLSEGQRLQTLQNDRYVASFTPTEVVCAKCRRTIRLDKRGKARYYLHFWNKHKLTHSR